MDLRARRFAAALIVVVGLHLLATIVYVARPLPWPGAARAAAAGYLEPYFTQSWSVFAPDPGTSNTVLQVRARDDGRTGPWFDVTECDLRSAVHHHPLPGRRYLTSFQLTRHYLGARADLDDRARPVVAADTADPQWARRLQSRLLEAGTSPARAERYIESDRAMTGYASRVVAARGEPADEVQVRVLRRHTVPWAARAVPGAADRVEVIGRPWRPQTPPAPGEQAVFDGLYRKAEPCG